MTKIEPVARLFETIRVLKLEKKALIELYRHSFDHYDGLIKQTDIDVKIQKILDRAIKEGLSE